MSHIWYHRRSSVTKMVLRGGNDQILRLKWKINVGTRNCPKTLLSSGDFGQPGKSYNTIFCSHFRRNLDFRCLSNPTSFFFLFFSFFFSCPSPPQFHTTKQKLQSTRENGRTLIICFEFRARPFFLTSLERRGHFGYPARWYGIIFIELVESDPISTIVELSKRFFVAPNSEQKTHFTLPWCSPFKVSTIFFHVKSEVFKAIFPELRYEHFFLKFCARTAGCTRNANYPQFEKKKRR